MPTTSDKSLLLFAAESGAHKPQATHLVGNHRACFINGAGGWGAISVGIERAITLLAAADMSTRTAGKSTTARASV
jgi:hypothetical protein